MSNFVETAKRVLTENAAVPYGIFGVIDSSRFFPPRTLLNQFLAQGNDPCDQDGRMKDWAPFTLSAQDYLDVKEWWQSNHAGSCEDSLDADNWNEWVQAILNP